MEDKTPFKTCIYRNKKKILILPKLQQLWQLSLFKHVFNKIKKIDKVLTVANIKDFEKKNA